ncbi:MAG: class I SAM-dependent methyltransferase [Clostridia bacterium]|nr:class I SAM-dependent methyltransferase [Clostridia bacterium]
MVEFYDKGNYVSKYADSHLDFSIRRCDALVSYINKKQKTVKTMLDLACGTGTFLNLMQEKLSINKCVGLDFSKKMLEYAMQNIKNDNVEFIYGDMTDFEFDEKFDLITCNYNAINELSPISKWEKVFSLAYKHLNDNGMFSFDFNTIYKFSNGVRTFYASNEEYDEVAKMTPNKDNSIEYLTITYEKTPDGQYIKEERKATEYVYNLCEIKKLLKKVGFKNIKIGDKNFDKCNRKKQNRLFVICEK